MVFASFSSWARLIWRETVGLFECEGGVGDIQLGQELAGFYGLADGYEDLLDAAAGAEGEGDFGFGFDAAGCADGTTDRAALDYYGFVAGLFVRGRRGAPGIVESQTNPLRQ